MRFFLFQACNGVEAIENGQEIQSACKWRDMQYSL